MGFKEKLTIFDVIFLKFSQIFSQYSVTILPMIIFTRKLETLIEQTIRYVWNNNPPRLVHKNWYL